MTTASPPAKPVAPAAEVAKLPTPPVTIWQGPIQLNTKDGDFLIPSISAERELDKIRIAELEKLVRDLKTEKFVNSPIEKVSFTIADFGNTDRGDIVSDLFRLYDNSRFTVTFGKDSVQIAAPEEIIAEIKVYMAKLKK